MKTILRIIGVVIIIGTLGLGCATYYIQSYNPETGVISDVLGRTLSEAPWFMRLIFDEGKLWAGWKWFFLDMVIFWGSVGIGMCLLTFLSNGRKGDKSFKYDDGL